MKPLYMHTDRSRRLESGMDIKLTPCAGECGLAGYAGMFADGFAEHVERLCGAGLGSHGRQYLVRFFESGMHSPLLFQELYLEYIRWAHGINEPSRFQSFYAWGSYEEAVRFAALDGKAEDPHIYEMMPHGRVFKGDMNLTRGRLDMGRATAYWAGERLDIYGEYRPVWEYVMELPVRVVRRVYEGGL